MPERPWFPFYPGDWRSDPKLRMCSVAARGLWIEMCCLMHEAQPYGHLLVNGLAPTDAQLTVLTGTPPDQLPALMSELDSAGVFSRTGKGVIYSRRMTRDAKKTQKARANGKKGGNPTLRKERGNSPSVNPPEKPPDKPYRLEAINQRLEEGSAPDGAVVGGADPPVQAAFDLWNETARRLGLPVAQKLTPERRRHLTARLRQHGRDDWERALENLAEAPFCLGENQRGWRADLDFVLQPKSFNRLLEGVYADRPKGQDDWAAWEQKHATD